MRLRLKRHGITLQQSYFEDPLHARLMDHVLPTVFMDSYSAEKPWGFITENRYTLLTDLTASEDAIFQNFPKDTRNQIRRCEREQYFTLNLNTQSAAFFEVYATFAKARGLSMLSPEDLSSLNGNDYCLLSADYLGKPFICHLYLLSTPTNIANLLLSVSDLHERANPDIRRAMGHANRCIHWQAMRLFKTAGFKTYDWGGYALDTKDKQLQGINHFKKTFNGTLTPIYNHYSLSYRMIEILRKWFKT